MRAPAPALAPTAHRRGILWMMAAAFLFATQDAVAKTLALDYSVPQVVWARFFFHFLFMALILNARLPAVLATARPAAQVLRASALLVMMSLFYGALSFLPLADATALLFLGPILVTALSVPFLGERVGPRRWAGVAVGFLGALIIIRPGFGVLQVGALLAVGAALLFALYQLATRDLSRTDAAMTTLAHTALLGAVGATLVVPFFWAADPDLDGWGLMMLIGACGGASQYSLIKAYEAAPAATVAPFFYTDLVWAVGYGFVLFAHLPDAWTAAGAAVIAASGLYIFRRAATAPAGEPRRG